MPSGFQSGTKRLIDNTDRYGHYRHAYAFNLPLHAIIRALRREETSRSCPTVYKSRDYFKNETRPRESEAISSLSFLKRRERVRAAFVGDSNITGRHIHCEMLRVTYLIELRL